MLGKIIYLYLKKKNQLVDCIQSKTEDMAGIRFTSLVVPFAIVLFFS